MKPVRIHRTSDSPRVVVSGIIVKTTGARIAFPKQAFVDLANPLLQTVSITSQGSSNLKLRFTGGEGAQNYEVEYFIEGNRLVRRNVSYFERGGGEKGRVVKTMSFGPAGEPTQQQRDHQALKAHCGDIADLAREPALATTQLGCPDKQHEMAHQP